MQVLIMIENRESMSCWIDRILQEFTPDLARLWIVADPDDVLLDEQILSSLRDYGFDVLPFEDSVVFRAEYETRYRAAWDCGENGPANSLVLHLRSVNISDLPWDYLRQARVVSLSLADLFPQLSYGVVRQIDVEHRASLFDAQSKHVSQPLGETQTKEFILTHIFRISPHLISRPEELWRELLRLHYRDAGLPTVLATHVGHILSDLAVFKELPITELFSTKSLVLRIVQQEWCRYLVSRGVTITNDSEPAISENMFKADIPFEHPDVRVIVDSMFMDGTLHPLIVNGLDVVLSEWEKSGIVQDPGAMRDLILEGIKKLLQTVPTLESSYRDWLQLSRHVGELIARFHGLDAAQAELVNEPILSLQNTVDNSLRQWVIQHYSDLSSLPAIKGPVIVHHAPRFLAMKHAAGEAKIAMLVFDGLSVDQWVHIRECLAKRSQRFNFNENACFAWLPTLTSVSRQALFSGLKPREFEDTIETTSYEPNLWARFWLDQGLRSNEIMYRKGIKRTDQLDELDTLLANPSIKIAGMVIDTIDEIVHGAVLGKRGIANQVSSWCDSGFIDRLLVMLLDKDFHVYLTADHGNVEAIGQGRPNQGVASELRGERVRTYRSEVLAAESARSNANTYRLNIAGLPNDFIPLFASNRTAFAPQGERLVVHGGISVEELIVPFVKINYVSLT